MITLSGLPRRFLTFIIDLFILKVLTYPLIFIISNYANIGITVILEISLICIILHYIYFTYFLSSKKQASLGQQILNIHLRCCDNKKISVKLAFYRTLSNPIVIVEALLSAAENNLFHSYLNLDDPISPLLYIITLIAILLGIAGNICYSMAIFNTVVVQGKFDPTAEFVLQVKTLPESKLSVLFRRLLAYIIDFSILMLAIYLLVLLSTYTLSIANISIITLFIGMLIHSLYFTCFLYSEKQASLGQQILNIYTTLCDHQKSSTKLAFYRTISPWIIIILPLSLIIIAKYCSNIEIISLLIVILIAISLVIVPMICCAWYLMAIFTDRQQTLHDKIFNTVVVIRRPSVN